METPSPLTIRIATRASPLARIQADMVAQHLKTCLPSYTIDTLALTTRGDQLTAQRLIDAGGKGLFTGEIDRAVTDGHADIGVHSLKDMPSVLPDGQEILAIPSRADPREGLLSPLADTLEDLPNGAVLGTASIRREAQALRVRPDLKIISFRGSVGTRLQKLEDGEADATFLAMAGLERLGQAEIASPIPIDKMCPAPCQGLIAVTGIKATLSPELMDALVAFEDRQARISAIVERAFLAELDGSCRTPIAAHARIDGDKGEFNGEVYGKDPGQFWLVATHFDSEADLSSLSEFGRVQARAIKAQAGDKLPQFQEMRW